MALGEHVGLLDASIFRHVLSLVDVRTMARTQAASFAADAALGDTAMRRTIFQEWDLSEIAEACTRLVF